VTGAVMPLPPTAGLCAPDFRIDLRLSAKTAATPSRETTQSSSHSDNASAMATISKVPVTCPHFMCQPL